MRRATGRVDPDLFHRAERVFHSALELDREQRPHFLESACGGDESLRREVDRLLEGDERPSSLRPELLDPVDPLARAGARIGAYRLLSELGRGGMGTVWLAERADEAFDRRVAIKLIPKGRDREEVLRRFENERQVLADLEHPHIARLLDGGATEDGRPYLVLEYIEGLPIDRHCDEERLPIEERLRLFRQVCSAVEHAHRNSVIHRDLKPSNVLVTKEGEPKLLDFGIAKVTGEQRRVDLTRTGSQPLTPRFASPEQLDGAPVTTATDVYSLGALLYLLLTGRDPYELEGRSMAECVRLIREQPPRPPSELVACSRDLDTIVLAALRKEPERRYPSAERLSSDVERHLRGLPIEARGDELLYVADKPARRHRVALAAAGAVGLALAGGLLVATGALEREANQRGLAEVRLEHIREFATEGTSDLVSTLGAIAGTTAATEKAMRAGLSHLERLAPEARDDPQLQAELARSYLALGRLQGDYGNATLGQTGVALASTQRGTAIAERLWAGEPQSLAFAYLASGALQQEAELLRALGRSEESEASLERALEVCATFDGAAGLEPRHFYVWALCWSGKHLGLSQRLRHGASIACAERALEIYDRGLSLFPAAWQLSADRARTLGDIANDHAALGELEQATAARIESIRTLTDLVERAGASGSGRRQMERDILLTESELAFDLGRTGDARGARELIDRVLAAFEERARQAPEDRQARLDLAVAYTGSGNVHFLARELDEARASFERAVSVWSELIAKDPARAGHRADRATGRIRLARAERASGRLAEAREHTALALAEREQLHAGDPANTELALATIEGCLELASLELLSTDGPTGSGTGRDPSAARRHVARAKALLEAAAERGTPDHLLAVPRARLEDLRGARGDLTEDTEPGPP